MSDRIWISWETQRRNRTLSTIVHAELHEFDLALPAWRRYPVAIWKTLALLRRERPRVIFAQNPSLVLAWLVVLYGRLTGRKVVIDAHNAGLRPAEGRYRLLNWLAAQLLPRAAVTIVSNSELVAEVEQLHGRAIAIPDPIPDIAAPEHPQPLPGAFNVLFVCSWAADEPWLEVLRAAAQVEPDTRIYVTGNSKGRERQLGSALPGNVTLTGFLPETEFNALLHRSDAVLVLTTRDNCLLCGAYEGVAAGKPLLLSDTRALRNHFSRGALYTANRAEAIAAAIRQARQQRVLLAEEVTALRIQRSAEYPQLVLDLEQRLATA